MQIKQPNYYRSYVRLDSNEEHTVEQYPQNYNVGANTIVFVDGLWLVTGGVSEDITEARKMSRDACYALRQTINGTKLANNHVGNYFEMHPTIQFDDEILYGTNSMVPADEHALIEDLCDMNNIVSWGKYDLGTNRSITLRGNWKHCSKYRGEQVPLEYGHLPNNYKLLKPIFSLLKTYLKGYYVSGLMHRNQNEQDEAGVPCFSNGYTLLAYSAEIWDDFVAMLNRSEEL